MKKIVILVAFLFALNNSLFAQNDKQIIAKQFDEYFSLMKQKASDKYLDYMYPKLFDIAPRDLLKQSFDNMFNDTTLSISFDSSHILEIEEPYKYEDVSYALVKYKFVMDFILLGDFGEKEQAEMTMGLMEAGMVKNFGEQNVDVDKSKRMFHTRVNGKMLMINDPKYEGWKMLELKQEQKTMLKQILPETIVEKYL